MFRGGPHRALLTEVFRSNTVGRVLRASPRLTGEPLPTSVGGDAHIAPPIGVNAPTFCTVSGSGAGAETILNLGHVLLKPYLPTGKEVKKPSGFLRIFGYFLCAQKVTRRGHGHADSATDPVKTQKKPPQQKCCGGWHPMQCIGLCPARPCKPSYNLHRVQQVGCLQHASPLPTSSRIRQPGGLRSTH